jgi:hypothetical protein
MGAQYEIQDLVAGNKYFIRVAAENSAGLCDISLPFNDECGAFIDISPSSILTRQFPDSPVNVAATVVVSEKQVEVSWIVPSSISRVTSYRVDAYMKSPSATSKYFSFFGDSEVQLISTAQSNVTAGTFTIAYDKFLIMLPGTMSAYSKNYVCNTSVDLSQYLEPGDQILVAGSIYTVAYLKFRYSWKLYVKERFSLGNDSDLFQLNILVVKNKIVSVVLNDFTFSPYKTYYFLLLCKEKFFWNFIFR